MNILTHKDMEGGVIVGERESVGGGQGKQWGEEDKYTMYMYEKSHNESYYIHLKKLSKPISHG